MAVLTGDGQVSTPLDGQRAGGDAREHHDQHTLAQFEPVAIIGMAMRLPGRVRTDTDFWNLLSQKKSGLCDVPSDRFNIHGFYDPSGQAGTIKFDQGYFLDDVDVREFDTSVFPISKTELERLDPCQRQLLQVAYECLESAGVSSWRGSDIGCYVGEFSDDWADVNAKETQHRGGYRSTGSGDFAMSNRISYEFDLHGPTMTVKTACSSSMVCLHLACQAIQQGQCESALVGGVSLAFSPTTWLALHDQGVLSPTGQSRTFDAAADGYARGEAVNMVLVKSLRATLRDGDPIRAIIRGTGVNGDGRTQGLLIPSPRAQADLIRRTYEAAGIRELSETAVFECHGTGTPVGDPLEAEAVADCFGDWGILITSVKPNIGHSEGAAGLTSLIKNVLALEHRMVLPNINFESPNPKIPFDKCKLRVPTELEPWPSGRAERVSVNSFGIGGMNAHVILESPRQYLTAKNSLWAKAKASDGGADDCPAVLLFSAYDAESLDTQIQSYRQYTRSLSRDKLRDLAFTLANRREHRPHRAFAVTSDDMTLQVSEPLVIKDSVSRSPSTATKVAWVFTGQGAQWARMGADLLDTNPTFRATIRKLDHFLLMLPEPPSWTIEEELRKEEKESQVHRATLGHPLCVALQIALVDVLRSWGVVPDVVLGHSSGEVGAAYASGAISAEAAIATAALRGSSHGSIDQKGAMAAIGLGPREIFPYLVPGVDVACENSQSSTTVSGDVDGIDRMIEKLKAEQPDVLARKLRVEQAYHSHHMRAYGESYEEHIRPYIHSRDPPIPVYSSVTGTRLTGDGCLDAHYWRANMERPVLFNSALRAAISDSGSGSSSPVVIVEIGPHPALAGPIGQILRDIGRSGDIKHIGTLLRGKSGPESLMRLAGTLYQHGVTLNYSVLCPPGRVLTDLPRYSWKRDTTHWAEPRVASEWRLRENPPHQLLGARIVETAAGEPSWRKVLALEDVPWLAGHEVNGQIVFPAAAYIAMIGEALEQLRESTDEGRDSMFSVRNVHIASARVLEMDQTVEVITSLKPILLEASEASAWYQFTIHSFDGTRWARNCFGEARASRDQSFALPREVPPRTTDFPRLVDETAWYTGLRRMGLNYSGLFEGIQGVSAATTSTDARATVAPHIARGDSRCSRYVLHPATIDQCFQVFTVASSHGIARNMTGLAVPTFVEEMVVSPSLTSEPLNVRAHVSNIRDGGAFAGSLVASVESECQLSTTCVSLKGLKMTAVTSNDGPDDAEVPLISQLEWRPHADFADLGSYMKRRESRVKEWPLLEELVLLCMLDHRDTITTTGDTAEHLIQFAAWMERQIERYRVGDNQFVNNTLRIDEKNMDQRLDRINELFSLMSMQDSPSPYTVCATAVHKLFSVAPAIFRGETHPLHVLLEDNVLPEFYEVLSMDSSEMIRVLGNTNPHMRILEIGAGTGGTTARVLKALTSPYGERLYRSYTYTDVSAGFMPAAKERFANHAAIEYAVLDVTVDPGEQGFQPGSYDLIIGANVVHATPSLNTTLTHLRRLLSPRGRLFLEELNPTTIWINYIMGFLPGWWLGAQDGRVDHPFVSPERWREELLRVGFAEPEAMVLDDSAPHHVNTGIIVAREIRQRILSRATLLCHTADGPYVAEMQHYLEELAVEVEICRFGDELPPQTPVISLLDLQEPVLYGMGEETFRIVQRYVSSHRACLIWMTPPAQVGAVEDPRAAMVIGFARSVRNELAVPFVTVEVDQETSPGPVTAMAVARILHHTIAALLDQHGSLNPDYEYAVVDGEILIPRLHWQTVSKAVESTPLDDRTSADDWGSPAALTVTKPGMLQTTTWITGSPISLPAEGEVVVETRAIGLNFRDVLIAMGVLENSPSEMGFEGSGVVRAVGPGVTQFAVGDRVMYIGSGLFRTVHRMSAALCVKMDDSMSFEQAAVVPCVYATALMALVDRAHLESGQSVLIHAACGGVGLAAIQIAQMLDAEIYCTVGSDAKRAYLTEHYGIPPTRIFNSRDSSFLPAILEATDGKGVDVVLNSLAGDLLQASWQCVAEFGTMVEIGKRDFQRRAALAMAPFEANRTFIGLELRLALQARPQQAASLLTRCMQWIREGRIQGPAIWGTFEAAQIQDALRTMQTAKHIGKIVIQMSDTQGLAKQLQPATTARGFQFRSDATYLLVGGLGGLGRALAIWMVENGARSLVFLSRSASEGSSTDAFVHELHSQGCQVLLVAGSVTDKTDVQRAVDNPATAARPLAGVINLSMVLKDVALPEMTFVDWSTVVEPKVRGTWNLHEAVANHKGLDFFVLLSSLGGIVGHWNQANYAAANTFLDAVVRFRHHRGLVASVINLGAVGDVGYVARNQEVLDHLGRSGMRILREQNFLDAIVLVLRRSQPQASLASLEPGSSQMQSPGTTVYSNPSQVIVGLNTTIPMSSPLNLVPWRRDPRMAIYYHLGGSSGPTTENGDRGSTPRGSLRARLTSIPDDESKTDAIMHALAAALASILLRNEESLALDQPLERLGIDSLVAMEVRSWIRQQLGVETSTISIVQSPSLRHLAGRLTGALGGTAGATGGASWFSSS